MLKHRPWVGKAENAWGGVLYARDSVNALPDFDPTVIEHYVQQFMMFTADATASTYEIFIRDADRLRRIRVECNKFVADEHQRTAVSDANDNDELPGIGDEWMQYSGIRRVYEHSDNAGLGDINFPQMVPGHDWSVFAVTAYSCRDLGYKHEENTQSFGLKISW